MTATPPTVHDSTIDDGYAKGDDVDPAREPGNGAIVLALYRGWNGQPDFERVWRREDRNPGQDTGSWFHVGRPDRDSEPQGLTLWGEVLGLDDPEPYGIGQVVLWPGGKNAFFW